MTESGHFNEYTIPTDASAPQGITHNANGTIFFDENIGNKISKMDNGYVSSNPQLDNGCGFYVNYPSTNGNYSETSNNSIGTTIQCKANGTGQDLNGMIIKVDWYLHYVLNNSNIHFNNVSATIVLTTNWYSNVSFVAPRVFNGLNQVCKVWFRALFWSSFLSIHNENKNYIVVRGYSNPFTILDSSQFTSMCLTRPGLNDNYTYGGLLNLNGTIGGYNLGYYDLYLDFWVYYVSNQSTMHLLNLSDFSILSNRMYAYYDVNIDVPYVDDIDVCRIIIRALIEPSSFSKNQNKINSDSDVIILWGTFNPFTISNSELNDDILFDNPLLNDNYSYGDYVYCNVSGTGTGLTYLTINADFSIYYY
jgi:hypothetical protein